MLEFVLLPVVGAFIGYVTNLIAVKMLFRPREERNLLGLKVQGLLPKRKEDLAVAIGEVVEREFLDSGDVGKVFSSANVEGKMEELLDSSLSNFSLNVPFLGDMSFLLRERIRGEIKAFLRENSHRISLELQSMVRENLDIKELVRDRIQDLELERLEKIILSVAGKEIRYITYFGGILGFIVGLAQAFLLQLLG